LKTVIDKVTRVGQMGYSNKKVCQEALIGLLGGIEYAKLKKRKFAVVSLI
jgi:hypothetical protein